MVSGGDREVLFSTISPAASGVDFANTLTFTEELNPYTYRNFFNGGGVGLGDFNQDGLLDIYLTGNLVDNKLYLNQGDFTFQDVTESAGVACSGNWSTGVAVVDINADGLPDIYVCKSGPPGGPHRHNELFVNRGDGTFSEEAAAYGLDFTGLSIQAAFFDYDRDGDLDAYLLNNSIRSTTGYDLKKGLRERRDENGNRLLRNDGGKFVDVSEAAGIYGSAIGFGLGVTVGDVNQDGLPDLFVSNDYFERDYLYYNQGDGTFKEALADHLPEISLGSMGADMADLNNDGLPELFVTEMLPRGDRRYKTKADFQGWNRYQLYRDQGYHQQFSRNVLQLNRGGGNFSEVGRMAGVEATDWSWGALLADLDGDGYKDIFVANGVGKDLLDRDYIAFNGQPEAIRKALFEEGKGITDIINDIPSEPQANGVFRNRDGSGLAYENVAEKWGLAEPTFSNGSAYGDLDNDGDLDLVINNIDAPAGIFRNNSVAGRQFTVALRAKQPGNPFAIGARVRLYAGAEVQYQELQPMRGFQSTVDYRLHFGVGDKAVDSLRVDWPDGGVSLLTEIPAGPQLTIDQRTAPAGKKVPAPSAAPLLRTRDYLPAARHRESPSTEFNKDGLLFQGVSSEGPALAAGDVNDDERPDLYLGGAAGQPGQLWIATGRDTYRAASFPALTEDAGAEDTDAAFFDADGDGDLDLYVCSGGYEAGSNSENLLDRLYLNDGNTWRKSDQLLPSRSRMVSSSVVRPQDVDGDGDLDLFVGGRLDPTIYGLPASSYLLINDGKGTFKAVSRNDLPALDRLGLVTDAQWADLDGDGRAELTIVGEWMPVTVLHFEREQPLRVSRIDTLANSYGLWRCLTIADLDRNGTLDLVAGNQGNNTRLRASATEPLQLHINDFDRNGQAEQLLVQYDEGRPLPFLLKDDLVARLPGLRKQLLRYSDYAGKGLTDLFPADLLARSIVLQATTLAGTAFYNDGKGGFTARPLPPIAQLSPTYAILAWDADGDGIQDLILGGNLSVSRPELGIYAAGFGQLLLAREGGGWDVPGPAESGVLLAGEVRKIIALGSNHFLVARSNGGLLMIDKAQ